jgi:hypothetical protein
MHPYVFISQVRTISGSPACFGHVLFILKESIPSECCGTKIALTVLLSQSSASSMWRHVFQNLLFHVTVHALEGINDLTRGVLLGLLESSRWSRAAWTVPELMETGMQVWKTPQKEKRMEPMELHRTYGGCFDAIADICWSTDSQWLAVASLDITARIFSLHPIPGEPIHSGFHCCVRLPRRR